jgi:hypothetical protein
MGGLLPIAARSASALLQEIHKTPSDDRIERPAACREKGVGLGISGVFRIAEKK